MKKLMIVTLLFVSVTGIQQLSAQNMGSTYKTALGAKGYFGDGSIGGINIKHFLNRTGALEGSLLFRDHYVALEGIYEWHGAVTGARGLTWYTGPGAQLGFINHKHRDHDDGSDAVFALKGTLGLDYKFTGAPIDIAFDVNPTFQLTPSTNFDFFAGMAFRFAL